MTDPITTPAEMRGAAALLATSFLVGDPQNGVPLRNPMAHEIAAAIRALPVADPLCTWPSCGHTAKGQCNPTFALRAIVAERRALDVGETPVHLPQADLLSASERQAVRDRALDEAAQCCADDPRIADYERAYQYALHLADTLRERHYPANTGWRPLGDLSGLLTQIDNMIAGFGPTQVIRDKALDDAAQCCDDEADRCDDAVKWGGHRRYIQNVKAAAYAMRDRAAAIRAMKGTRA